jgi:phenylpropionate dioxygenase-like ring-hydroxylating dioxygenase large terminal subunit
VTDMQRATDTFNEDIQEAPGSFAAKDWPLDAWYAAAWDVELKHELLARTICGENLVFYRTSDGAPVALQDACWHRLVPLSKGSLKGDEVACGYHGLMYDSDGRCTFMPSQSTINPVAAVRSYPIVERHRFAWVWMGDPANADPDLIPDMHWNDDAGWAGEGRTIHAECNYKLVVDNLMDLTHETFVHGDSIGDDAVAEAPFEVTHGDRKATVTRWMIDIEGPPFWRAQLEDDLRSRRDVTDEQPGNVDRWQIIHFTPPSTIVIEVGVAPHGTGAPEGDRSQGVDGRVLNTMTPETATTCHYFWNFARSWDLDSQKRTTQIREGVTGIFAQDEEVLAAQQQAIDENPGRIFYNLNLDGGAMWARRLIDRMMADERGQTAPDGSAAAAANGAAAGGGAANGAAAHDPTVVPTAAKR